MSLYLKVMSDEPLPDHDTNKNFIMVAVPFGHRVVFAVDESYPPVPLPTQQDIDNGMVKPRHYVAKIGRWAGLVGDGFQTTPGDDAVTHVIPLTGNAYLLSEAGKTIASHAAY
jgi:hypothetical protein